LKKAKLEKGLACGLLKRKFANMSVGAKRVGAASGTSQKQLSVRSTRRICRDEELFVIEHNKRFLIYAPLRRSILEVNETAASALANSTIDSRFEEELCAAIADKPRITLPSRHSESDDFRPYAVGLCLTDKCNLACHYCHANSGINGHRRLPWEIAQAALDLVIANGVSNRSCVEVTFPGTGEPTQSWDALARAVTYVLDKTTTHPPGCKISMSTNGVFSRSHAEFIADHFTAVSLSLDGPADIHNAHRPCANGEGSFSAVVDTANYFFQRGFLFSIRATVSELSVNRMEEIWDFFEKHFPGVAVSFERMNPLGRGADSSLRPPSTRQFTQAFERLLNEAPKHKGLLLNSGIGKLNQIRTCFCKSLSYPCMTVTPDGKVSACQRDGSPTFFHYGYWDNERKAFSIDSQKVRFFRSLTVQRFPECVTCFAKYHCAGDCYDLRRAGIRRCSTNKRIILMDIFSKLDFDKSITSVTLDDPRYLAMSQRLHHH